MSLFAIHNWYKDLDKMIKFGGSRKETAIRTSFQYLLNEYAKQKDLYLIPEISIKNKSGKIITPDGTIKDSLQNDWGYWESKDESDDIKEEVKKKFKKGYPNDNILFEDSQTAILYQTGIKVMQVNMQDENALDKILTKFINYERPEVKNFREAIEKFKEDIPKVASTIKVIINEQQKTNKELVKAQNNFLVMCKSSINEDVTLQDVIEMMVQHILSADIFNTIFDEPHFHQENNIARELNNVLATFFTGTIRKQTLGSIKHYYDTINARAAQIADHHEKQKFLKIVYENFYKGYNPKSADKLGIVYTPNEIVNFMITITDYLLHKHFGKTLGDKNVDIFDPATGTGTFICELIDYIHPSKLKNKYKNELHANEVAILPYYIANLNIEYTYKQKMGEYEEFENLCFADTLDKSSQHLIQAGLFSVSTENTSRIRKQNEKKISIVIGNPPYNANQQNENDNNKNRIYESVDNRIRSTFIKNSTAQKTKMYDMYSRFYRWAMDRLNENGIITFVTNRSFIDSRTFDGFRKTIQDDFDFAYIIDTKSDVRSNTKIAGTTHNVFGIQAGVAIMFLIKTSHKKIKQKICEINYFAMNDYWLKAEKLHWFSEHKFEQISFDNITPDKNNNWLNITDNDWDSLIDLSKVFNISSNGINTARDEWVFDFDFFNLVSKSEYFIKEYNNLIKKEDVTFPDIIKWSETLKLNFKKNITIKKDEKKIIEYLYRPYVNKKYYSEKKLSDRLTSNHYKIFGNNLKNKNNTISFSGQSSNKKFSALAIDKPFSFDFIEKTQCFPSYFLDKNGKKNDNITDWALQLFQKKYKDKAILKQDIFNYVYAVFHCPNYLKKYETNLKREFPRIPLYKNFKKMVNLGKELMSLHLGYESAAPYKLKVENKKNKDGNISNPKLKAIKESGIIILDDETQLSGIPSEAWEYKLGNRSALEWILDQYKEKKPTDNTIAEKFNSYKFSDYKEFVIDLIKRVCTISIKTVEIINKL